MSATPRSKLPPLTEAANTMDRPCAECGHPRSATVVSLHGGPGETPERAVPRYRCAACINKHLDASLARLDAARAQRPGGAP